LNEQMNADWLKW